MKNKITIILAITILLALPLIFAMYGGENQTIQFGFETDNCTIVPNVTEGINFTPSGNTMIVQSAINFIGEFNITCYDWLTKQEETQSGGSAAPSGWSAKCLYNKECLYGISNETSDNKTEVIPEEVIEDIPEPIIQEEKKSKLKWILLGIIIIAIVGIIYWWNYKPNPIYDNYDKEVNENE